MSKSEELRAETLDEQLGAAFKNFCQREGCGWSVAPGERFCRSCLGLERICSCYRTSADDRMPPGHPVVSPADAPCPNCGSIEAFASECQLPPMRN